MTETKPRPVGAQWRVAISSAMLVVYVAFILLVGFERPLLERVIIPGLSVGILCGVIVIVVCCILTWTYVGWCNSRRD
jgi:uncharacterized membrane protein (DUF485 family)